MHSRIFQISTEPIDKENYLNEDTLQQGGCVKSKNQVFFDILYKKDFISLLC